MTVMPSLVNCLFRSKNASIDFLSLRGHHDHMVLLLGILVATPIALMISAQVYAMRAQDSLGRFVVLTGNDIDPADVAHEHRRRFGVRILDVWRSSESGYSATIPLRKVRKIEADYRVRSIFAHEDEEHYLHPQN